ncbi:methyltransferase domain-containing protein [Candidatus Uhrbacteria bacterium]|nr:methyltransferase domain-containing protein [Candidatus Uhrbacteria bacterium]
MIAYDPTNKRLALFQREATPESWDEQWNQKDLKKNISSGKTHHFIERFTKKYLSSGGRILEGGCGTGQVVFAMRSWGYDACGVDYAQQAIATTNALVPSLQVSAQDVRATTFPNAFFDGYWSLGVIEHFWDGFAPITKEAHRVLKPAGTLFLTFPWMSPLRRMKAHFGLYPRFDSSTDPTTFYEFMLDKERVVRELETQGFACAESYPYDALKGIKDEIAFLHLPLQKLYNSRSASARAIRYLFTIFFSRLCGHMLLLVCKKSSSVSP